MARWHQAKSRLGVDREIAQVVKQFAEQRETSNSSRLITELLSVASCVGICAGVQTDCRQIRISILRSSHSSVATPFTHVDKLLVTRLQEVATAYGEKREVALRIYLTDGTYAGGGLYVTVNDFHVRNDWFDGHVGPAVRCDEDLSAEGNGM